MLAYCAVYVDVGYLLAAAATRVTGTSWRSGIEVDYRVLIDELIDQTEARSGLPLLRVNWYDAGGLRRGLPDDSQEAIGLLSRVKLRLGRRNMSGEQKGIDVRLGLDLVTHARSRIADVMYLISGDDDLTEAVEDAQSHGIRVVVLAVPDSGGAAHAVSRHLQRAADGVELIAATAIDDSVKATSTPAAGPVGTAAEAHEAPALSAVPSPADVALRLGTRRPPLPASQDRRSELIYTSGTGQAGDGSVSWAETVHDETVDAVCTAVLSAWTARASTAERDDLRAGKPYIPSDIDRALLLDLSQRLQIYDLDEPIRILLRKRFWELAEQTL